MRREFSAGGVVVRRLRGRWHLAAIRPGGKTNVWALPKGLIGPGRTRPTRLSARSPRKPASRPASLEKLGDVRYVYTWRGERVFKVVSFFLLRYSRGRLGDIPAEHAHEVEEARWLPLEDAPRLLAYGGEREMAEKAAKWLGGRGFMMRAPR